MIHLVLYQPDMAPNLGAVLRLSAVMGCVVHVVEPCGFPLDHARMRRAGMDYIDRATLVRHLNWQAFQAHRAQHPGRLLLLETDGAVRYTDMAFVRSDYIVLGSESAGTPRALYAEMDTTLTIPMRDGARSLNLAMSAGMLVAEACRQLGWAFEL